MARARKPTKKSAEPLYDEIVPKQFVAALNREPSDVTLRLVIADWMAEHDRPEIEAVWRWFAATGKRPVELTGPSMMVASRELGTDRRYAANYVRDPAWGWVGAGWSGTCLEPAALGLHLSDGGWNNPTGAIVGLLQFRLGVVRDKNTEFVDRLDRLVPGTEQTTVEAGDVYSSHAMFGQPPVTLEWVFNAIRRRGGTSVEVRYSGGNDSGGVDEISVEGAYAVPIVESSPPNHWDDETKTWVADRAPTEDEILYHALTHPVYNRYYGFDGEPYVGGRVIWDTDDGTVTIEGTESYTEYGPDEDDDDDYETRTDDVEETIHMT